ncbi:MAG: hypothetical protein AABY22_12335, partial [Nanoarchaeota archaeon]
MSELNNKKEKQFYGPCLIVKQDDLMGVCKIPIIEFRDTRRTQKTRECQVDWDWQYYSNYLQHT